MKNKRDLEIGFFISQYQSFGPDLTLAVKISIMDKDGEIEIDYCVSSNCDFPNRKKQPLSSRYFYTTYNLVKLLSNPLVSEKLSEYLETAREVCWTPHPADYRIQVERSDKSFLLDWEGQIGLFDYADLPDGILKEIYCAISSIINDDKPYVIPEIYLNALETVKCLKEVELSKRGNPINPANTLMDSVFLPYFEEHKRDWWKSMQFFGFSEGLESFLYSLYNNCIDWKDGLEQTEIEEVRNFIKENLGREASKLFL
jgi:hypothetical protein